MDRHWDASGAAAAPTAPANVMGPNVYPQGGVSPSQPGPWWFHMITEELRAVIVASGETPDRATLNQLATALQAQGYNLSLTAGTADAITVAFTPALTAFTSGPIWWRASAANATTTPTIKRDGLAAKTLVKGNNLALAPGDIPGAGAWMCSQYDATLDKEVLFNPATGIKSGGKQIQPIAASVAANALTLTLNPTQLDFRSSIQTNGTVNSRTISSPISLTISSGSTLGTVNAVAARIAVLAIDNAGTVELAAVNLAGGNNLDETALITTTAEGGAGAADSANVIYSATARAGVPFRVVGFIDISEAAAGTWATAPTLVQGVGGQALVAMASLGYGQTWQNVTGSRTLGTTYYNTTGKPIFVSVYTPSASAAANLSITVGGIVVSSSSFSVSGALGACSVYAIVPPNASYSASGSGGATWIELR